LRGLAAGGTQFTGTITAAAANFSGAVGVGANNFGSTALSIAYPSASVNGLGVSNTSAGGEVWWIGDGVGSSAGRFCFYSNTHSAIPLYFTYNQVTVNTALNYGGVTLSNSVTGTGSMVLSSGPRFSSPVGIGAAGVTVATYDTLQIGTTSGSSIGTGGLINFVGGAAGTRGYIFCDASLSGLIIQRGTNTDPIRFVDQNTADMGRFGTDGSFLIGTTTNGGWHGSDKLESYVGGTGSAALSGYNSGTTGGALRLRVNATGVDFADFYYSTSVVGYISTNGTATAYNTTSDARLKDNITDAPDAGAIIDALRVRSWDWKSTGAHEEFGFVAQEEFTVYAPAVSEGDADPDAITKQWGRDDSKLVPLLVKEIQSLRARVKNLEGTH
jgi:hypothetical protein